MICKSLPAVSGGSGLAARRLGSHLPLAVIEILAPMATIAGAMPGGALGASAPLKMSSQASADAKREAKEARDREKENRQTLQQYKQSRRESVYVQLQDAAAEDLQVHTLSSRHHAACA